MKKDGKLPISRHPLFPATVALWTGAISGLGSLAIGTGPFEGAIQAAHIAKVFPAAAPPLGATFRILLALAFAGIGGIAGAMLARRFARPKPVAKERKRVADKTASEDKIDPAGEDENAAETDQEAVEGRTRDPDSPSRPGEAGYSSPPSLILNVRDFGLEGFDPESEAAVSTDDVAWDSAGEDEPAEQSVEEAEETGEAASTMELLDNFDDEDLDAAASAASAETPTLEPSPAETALSEAQEGDVTHAVQPAPFAPPSDAEDAAPFASPAGANAISQPVENENWQCADTPEISGTEGSPSVEFTSPASASEAGFRPEIEPKRTACAADRIASADLSDLSHVELLERLALSMERRRANRTDANDDVAEVSADDVAAPAAAPVLERLASSERNEEVPQQEEASPDPVDEYIPAALRPVSLSGEDDAEAFEDPVQSIVPPRQIASEDDEDGTPDDGILKEGYSSLLNLSRSQGGRQQFVRIEEPEPDASDVEPVVVFPSQTRRYEISAATLPGQQPCLAETGNGDANQPQSDEEASSPAQDSAERVSEGIHAAGSEEDLRSALTALRGINRAP